MGQDKGLILFKNKRLVESAIDCLKPLCNHILISSNNTAAYGYLPYEIVIDQVKNLGPVGGLYSGLKRSKTEHNLILSCDSPFVTPSLFEYLLTQLSEDKALVPRHGDGLLEPLIAYYSKSALEEIELAISNQDYKLMGLLKNLHAKTVEIHEDLKCYHDNLFSNFNYPEDLINGEKGSA